MACNNRDQLLMRVYETGFALDDILLYLDTHPSDQEAMNYYHMLISRTRRRSAPMSSFTAR